MRTITQSLGALILLTVLTGGVHPLLVTGTGMLFFPEGRMGEPSLIAQPAQAAGWFRPRPSAGSYSTTPSGASNLAPSNQVLQKNIKAQKEAWGNKGAEIAQFCPELLMSSGSGLDPHLSMDGALAQVPGICRARSLTSDQCQTLEALVRSEVEVPQLGFLGRARVNVNRLNLALAQRKW